MAGRLKPHRGEVWIVDFDPSIGAEIKKTRPALVIQNDTGNRVSQTTIVAAITSTIKNYPFQVFLPAGEGGIDNDSAVSLNQIRTIDMRRLRHRLGRVRPEIMRSVDAALLLSLGVEIE